MAELDGIKLNPESQLLLEAASIRLPYELSRRNLKSAQKHIEKERDHVLAQLKALQAGAAAGKSNEQIVAQLDSLVVRLMGFKKKLQELEDERQLLYKQTEARIKHVSELWQIPTVSDVKYEAWSKIRLDRLLVDYMLRNGHIESAQLLAEEKGIQDLVDVDLFTSAHKVATALQNGSLTEALAWCSEHKPLMKNLKSPASNPNLKAGMSAPALPNLSDATSTETPSAPIDILSPLKTPAPSATALEFQLRLQQCINLLNPPSNSNATRDVVAARAHITKYLSPHLADPLHRQDVLAATMLLIVPSDAPTSRYSGYYDPARWKMLSELFTSTFLELWGLPRESGLQRALKAGLTALKTPSCHSQHVKAENVVQGTVNEEDHDAENVPIATIPGSRLCPICSTELNSLAKDLPYAHHSQSLVEPDPVVLPNNRIYGKSKLIEIAEKMGLKDGLVRDPVTGEKFDRSEMQKVFIM